MPRTPVRLTIHEPQPGCFTPERVLLVCPRCQHPFLRSSAALAHGAWSFPCPACNAGLALDALAGRSLLSPEQWVFIKCVFINELRFLL